MDGCVLEQKVHTTVPDGVKKVFIVCICLSVGLAKGKEKRVRERNKGSDRLNVSLCQRGYAYLHQSKTPLPMHAHF